ncbi:MAG: SCO family protein [Alphaproteobacteria bacterium]
MAWEKRPSRAAVVAAMLITAAVGLVTVRLVTDIGRALPGREGEAPDSGTVEIGGPFTLVDQYGQLRTEADFRGKFTLVYFGYTFCPDVCPLEVAAMGAAIDALGPDGAEVVPVFITIDPARDTVEQLKAFAGQFHPRLVALTGTEAQIAEAARGYRVYYAKNDAGAAAAGAPDDYLMDHTSIVYLMDEQGRYAAHFTHGTPADEMAARIAELL